MLQSSHMRMLILGLAFALAVLPAARTASADVERHPCVPRSAEIRFRAADGTRLAGYRLGRGRTAVVLAHQVRGDACQWAGYARRLARLGYFVIAFDFRGYGDSQVRGGRAANRLAADVAAAAKAARARGAGKVFAVGASMGGTAVLAAGVSARPQLNGVVSLSGSAVFSSIDALGTAPRLTVPVLYLVGQLDADFALDAQRLYDATGSTDKSIQVLPVGLHGVDLVRWDGRARALVEGFISSH
ncbi:MAG TPA: alpha/beta fold hydrolase [Gaiellaceae bacterium]|nr:alpha/beta fold hydrolase [Gaiellaceae bacterium]HET8651118.1 alpha/beta fold hydrolase [Gaiellaceae bacterium]